MEELYELDELDLNSSIGSIMFSTENSEIENNEIENNKIENNKIACKPKLFKCRFCHEEASKEELISPCACTENWEFIHVRCLEKSVYNVTSKPICMYCKGLLPLELKYRPLIEICRNSRKLCRVFPRIWCALFVATAMITYGIFMIYLFVILFKLLCKSNTFIDVICLITAIFVLSSVCIYQGIVFKKQWKTRKEHKWRGNTWHMYVIKTLLYAQDGWLETVKEWKIIDYKLRELQRTEHTQSTEV